MQRLNMTKSKHIYLDWFYFGMILTTLIAGLLAWLTMGPKQTSIKPDKMVETVSIPNYPNEAVACIRVYDDFHKTNVFKYELLTKEQLIYYFLRNGTFNYYIK